MALWKAVRENILIKNLSESVKGLPEPETDLVFLISPNHRSIIFNREEWVGMKCVTNLPSTDAQYSFTSFVLWVE
jgi:hypothetical protein